MKRLAMLAMLGVAGCVSVEDIRSYPPHVEATVPERFDELTACIADAYQTRFPIHVTPIVSQRQRRGTVLLAQSGYMGTIPFAEFEVQGQAEASSVVRYRRRKSVFNQQTDADLFRDILRACVPGWKPAANEREQSHGMV
jgi:hypothetical protein